ncbi:hypothetical protein WN55_00379 [Dufourea novaeangliae]|uniref:Uncharacterized protein n=1 Tax=Dufourea novaeangliae TaxID=178035 RepID=A0A154PFN1_DUFNO|nr:hypothetical protein WN55_00379 [Dufourea novaeangliae]
MMRRFERMMATPTTKMKPACMRASSEGSSMPPPFRAASPPPALRCCCPSPSRQIPRNSQMLGLPDS